MTEAYRYTFREKVPLQEAIESLYLAIFASEGIHGRAQVLLEAGYAFDEPKRTLVVAAASAVGKTISRIFTALLSRQFGEGAFSVEQVGAPREAGGEA